MGVTEKYLIVDVGGTSIKYALFSSEGELCWKKSQAKKEYTMPDLVDSIVGITESLEEPVSALGVSANMILNHRTGESYGGSLYRMDGDSYPLQDELARRLKMPVSVVKDSNAAMLAELRSGSLQGAENAIAIILGTGIGMSICLNGGLVYGDHEFAGEASMMIIGSARPEAIERSTWMSLNSVPFFMYRAASELGEDPKAFDGLRFFEMIEQGSEKATALFDDYCTILAVQIMNLTMLLDIKKIAVGGGISAQERLFTVLQKHVEELNEKLRHNKMAPPPEIIPCQFRNDTNLIGAYYCLKERLDNMKEEV